MSVKRTLPAAPVLDAIEDYLGLGCIYPCLGRGSALAQMYWEAQQSGRVTINAADKLCVKVLGRHPAEVYGEAWWTV